MVERSGAFPIELMNVKNKEVLENNPIEPGMESNGINHWHVSQKNFEAAEDDQN